MADHWTNILEYLTYTEARACKAISTDVRLAARTVLEVGRFEKVNTALWLIPRLLPRHCFAFPEEKACVRAAWSIEPRLVAKAAVTCGQDWILAVLEPTLDGLPRIVASLEGVRDAAFPQAFSSWTEMALYERKEELLRNDEEYVRAVSAAVDDSLNAMERDDWGVFSWDILRRIEEVVNEEEGEVCPSLYRELGRWADVKRVVNLYYLMQDKDESFETLTADHAAYLSSDWPDETKRAAFIDAASEDHKERFVLVSVRGSGGATSRATAPR
jgi:hypothetical protein